MESVNEDERAILINLSSEQCPNLKTVLKYMSQHATSRPLGADEDTANDGGKVCIYVDLNMPDPLM